MSSGNTYSTYSTELQGQILKDLMDLFRSNNRGYGVGEFSGAKYNEDKNKWTPGGVRWNWGPTTEGTWVEHLTGTRLIGQGVLCDDNRCWYACLDIDDYDIDYTIEMAKIKASGLPLIVFRTKSGGLRVVIFFSEPIDAELIIPRMRKLAASLGYANCEIFPKQTKLDVEHGDCPSWIYMPYGGTAGMFPEQGAMNEMGNLLMLDEAVSLCMNNRLSQQQFLDLFKAEENAKSNGKANGRRHPKGAWVQEDSYELNVNTIFHDGPCCLWTISHDKNRDFQNNFLLNVSTFLKRKYPENWDKCLEWVNYNVLQPVGDRDKLNEIIKRGKTHTYEYMCQQEPICSHCNPHACRRMPFGVGDSGSGGVDFYELGITIINRDPQIFILNIGDNRVMMDAEELLNQQRFKVKCLASGAPFPHSLKREEWENVVRRAIDNATVVEPPTLMRTHAQEIEILTTWFGIYVPGCVRRVGVPYLNGGAGRLDDAIRVRIEERRFYFKWQRLSHFCLRSYSGKEAMMMRTFVNNKCEEHRQGPGIRDWYRHTYSIGFDVFDDDVVNRWLNPDKEEEEDE